MMSRESNEQQENIEIEKPSMLEDFDACVDVIALIEAEYKSQPLDERDRSTLRSMMNDAADALKERMEMTPEGERDTLLGRSVTGFQGLGGFNRYEVRGDGSIILSRSHTVGACRKKAEELGVDISEY